MSKRVLLTAPFTKGDLFEHRWVTPHLGLWRIASYLERKGHTVKIYDKNAPNEKEFTEILKEGWDVIGFSDLEATIEYTIPKMIEARMACPSAFLIAGGSGPALRYQYYLDNTPIDAVALAEGEYPLVDICEGKDIKDIEGIVYRKRAKVLSNDEYWDISEGINYRAMQIDKFWDKTASFYDDPDYGEINTVRLFTSNYCPMGCKFCTLTNWRKNASGRVCPVVGVSASQIITMVKEVMDAYPKTRQIFFVDDDFFLNQKRGFDFCHEVIMNKVRGDLPEDLKFICLTNINRINQNNIEYIAEAGFRVLSIGVESTSQHVLDSLNKKQTVEQIWTATELILKHGVKPYYTVILFTPHMTVEDLLTDIQGFKKMSEMGCGLSLEPYLIPLPGTPFWDDYLPMSMREVKINDRLKIKKGFAWYPLNKEVKEIFDEFERWYPKYRRHRFDSDGIKHKEKNYQAKVILDAVEMVLYKRDSEEYKEINKIDVSNVDVVGDIG